jgi:hypothetical protein
MIRSDIDEPRCKKSNTARDDPIFATPKSEHVEPSRE